MATATISAPAKLERGLGLLDATMIVVGSMIGSGIFITSAESSRLVGSPGWLLMAWALAGVLTITGALCCAELAAMWPRAGGQYVFLREAYGPSIGFLFGWGKILDWAFDDPQAFQTRICVIQRIRRQCFNSTTTGGGHDSISHVHQHSRAANRSDNSERIHIHKDCRVVGIDRYRITARLESQQRGIHIFMVEAVGEWLASDFGTGGIRAVRAGTPGARTRHVSRTSDGWTVVRAISLEQRNVHCR